MHFFSKTTNGFYNNEIHGKTMPEDVVEVSDELYEQIFVEHATGKVITSDEYGNPITVPHPELSGKALIKNEIAILESTITTRRIRDAIAGTDEGWLAKIDSDIAKLRAKLVKTK